jgi:cobalt-zinc-cadmium efflux system outer membrane protein
MAALPRTSEYLVPAHLSSANGGAGTPDVRDFAHKPLKRARENAPSHGFTRSGAVIKVRPLDADLFEPSSATKATFRFAGKLLPGLSVQARSLSPSPGRCSGSWPVIREKPSNCKAVCWKLPVIWLNKFRPHPSRRKILQLSKHYHWLFLGALLAMPTLGADLPVLSLADAVERALSRHAVITAAEARVHSTEGQLVQARAHPNPAFTFQMENWRFSGSPAFQPAQDVDWFAYVSQRVETGGKRARRTDVGRQNTGLAALELELVKWNVRQEVRRAYYRALLAQKRLQMMIENNESFQQIVEYHRFRVREGAMAEADLIKVELEAARLGLERETGALESERSRFDLLKTMGESATTANLRLADPGGGPFPGMSASQPAVALSDTGVQSSESPGRGKSQPGDLSSGEGSLKRTLARDPTASSQSSTGGSLEPLLQVARQKRLEVQLSQAMVEQSRAKLALDKTQAHPDWSVLWGYKRTAGFNTLMAGVSVPLPFFDRNQGAIASDSSELDRAQSLLRSALTDVETEVAAALGRFRRRYAMLSQMRERVLDQAEESFRISLAAYQEGGTDLLRLLDAQRARNEIRLLQTQAEIAYQVSRVELEAAVGQENLPVSQELLRDTP